MRHGGNQHNDLQKRGSNLSRLSKRHIFSRRVPLRPVGTMRGEGLKCQKNGTVVEKFDLGQAEEDSGDRLSQCMTMTMTGPVGVRRIRSRDVKRTYATFVDSVDLDVNDLVRRSLLRH
jgi:hypothetical protein